MNSWRSYQLQDFIPFSSEVYWRLLARMNESFWPLQLVTIMLGIALLLLAVKQRGWLLWLLLAPIWAFVGLAFFIQRYAELNWAGRYVGYAFISQAVLFVVLSGLSLKQAQAGSALPGKTFNILSLAGLGAALVVFALAGLPLMAVLTGASWVETVVFGIHPDATALGTLGLLLIMYRGWRWWAVAVIPLLWLLASGLTLLVLAA